MPMRRPSVEASNRGKPTTDVSSLCERVCLCMCMRRPMISNKAIAFAMIHHHSTALLALQQCSSQAPIASFPPSQHNSNTMYTGCIPTVPHCATQHSTMENKNKQKNHNHPETTGVLNYITSTE